VISEKETTCPSASAYLPEPRANNLPSVAGDDEAKADCLN